MKKQDESRLMKAEAARAAANEAALQKAANEAAEAAAARKAEKAAEAEAAEKAAAEAILSEAAAEYQREAAAEMAARKAAAAAAEAEQEKADEMAMREEARRLYKGKFSSLGHRAGSEGWHMDMIISAYIKAEGKYPPAAPALRIFGKGKGIDGRKYPLPYADGRINGHLNHLQSHHNSAIPACARQGLKAAPRQGRPPAEAE